MKLNPQRRHGRHSNVRQSINTNYQMNQNKGLFNFRNPFNCCTEVSIQSVPSIIMHVQPRVPHLKEWLTDMRLEQLHKKFVESGFD